MADWYVVCPEKVIGILKFFEGIGVIWIVGEGFHLEAVKERWNLCHTGRD